MGIYSSHPSLGDIVENVVRWESRIQQDCFEADSVVGKQASWWPCPETCQTEPVVQSRPYSGASHLKPSASRGAQAINTYRPGSKKRRATQRRHPSQMPGPPGKRRDAAPTSTTSPSPSPATPRRRHSTVLALGTLPPSLSRTRPMVCIAEPTFFADSFRYSLPPYTTTPQQVPGPLRCESASLQATTWCCARLAPVERSYFIYSPPSGVFIYAPRLPDPGLASLGTSCFSPSTFQRTLAHLPRSRLG